MNGNTPETSNETSKGLFGETNRASGEYHFRNGYTQQVYSNAHFVPVDETTVPPKYYKPLEKNEENQENSRSKNKRGGLLLLTIMMTASAVLGGIVGALAVIYSFGLVARDSVVANDISLAEGRMLSSEPVEDSADISAEERLSAADIYDLACAQSVSVSVDIVNYDIFGNQIPSVISGSGMIISSDGYIVTNYHVVENAVRGNFNVTVSMYNGDVYIGKIAAAEADNDIAIIKIEAEGLSTVSFGNSDDIRVGDEVYAVGNPYGMLEFTMTTGHISALDRDIATESDELARNMFQIDAAVFSGNSGGPVYDENGSVIGIVTAKYSVSGAEGIGFAIPVNVALPVIDELLDKGYVGGKASLGVVFDERYSSIYSRYYRLPDGAYVYSVNSGSCAEKAGICHGDIIMQIGDHPVDSYNAVTGALKYYKAGDTADVYLYRSREIVRVPVVFDEAVPKNSGMYESTVKA